MGNNWVARIIKTDTGELVRQTEPGSERRAEKIEDGMMINLNHDEYHTEVADLDTEAMDVA